VWAELRLLGGERQVVARAVRLAAAGEVAVRSGPLTAMREARLPMPASREQSAPPWRGAPSLPVREDDLAQP
jgi:hypothetical protein